MGAFKSSQASACPLNQNGKPFAETRVVRVFAFFFFVVNLLPRFAFALFFGASSFGESLRTTFVTLGPTMHGDDHA